MLPFEDSPQLANLIREALLAGLRPGQPSPGVWRRIRQQIEAQRLRNWARPAEGPWRDPWRGQMALRLAWRGFLDPVHSALSVEPFYFLTLRMMAEKAVYNFRCIM